MTSKSIKNEQWYVKELVARIDNGEICKPKFQRKRKWDIQPKKDTVPSERNYIDFLRETKNSVHPITFGLANGKYTNIDGNNRINAITHFVKLPFEIYPEYLEPVKGFITEITGYISNKDEKDSISSKLLEIFSNLSYSDIMEFKYNKYFINIGQSDLYKKYLQSNRDTFEEHVLEELQFKLSNKGNRFDNNITINVNIFEGHSNEELSQIFGQINKYSNSLTARELLASTLFTKTNFKIEDKVFREEIYQVLRDNYSSIHNSEDEKLQLYKFDDSMPINAYDFIIGFEILMSKTSKIIGNQKSVSNGLSLFFKVFKVIYGDLDGAFITKNINDFIRCIHGAVDILVKIEKRIGHNLITSISAKTFENCQKKISSLSTNSQTVLVLGIIGHLKNKTPEKDILVSVEKCVLFHLMFEDIRKPEDKDKYKRDNKLSVHSIGGTKMDEMFNKVYKHPTELNSSITKDKMSDVLDILITENINMIKHDKKRKTRKFWEGTLIQYYYNIKMPHGFLDKKYWIEHIFPFSSDVPENATVDIDRLGNIIPIIDEINSKRGNKHIREYSKISNGKDFIKHLSDIIPDIQTYDSIITHNEPSAPTIINPTAYSELCSVNEKKYRDTFLAQLFPN